MSVPTITSEKESVLNANWIGGLIACFVLAQAQAGSNMDMLRLGTRVGQIPFKSIIASAKWLWNAQSYTHEEIVESDPITNSVAFSRSTL